MHSSAAARRLSPGGNSEVGGAERDSPRELAAATEGFFAAARGLIFLLHGVDCKSGTMRLSSRTEEEGQAPAMADQVSTNHYPTAQH